MKLGYARVSTTEQHLERQLDALNAVGVERIIEEKFSGKTRERDGLNRLLETVRDGDTVVVESISRLGRNTLDILSVVEQLDRMGVTFISLKENMDTSTPTGKAMFQMMCVIAELERNLIAERVREGLEATKRRGTQLGRPKLDKSKVDVALRMYDDGSYSVKEIIETTGVSRGSLYRALDRRKAAQMR